MPTFGEKLRKLRKHQGLSQADLALLLGYTDRSQIAFLELGQRNPTVEVVLKLSDLFGVTTDQLIRDELDVDPGFTASDGEDND
ncbi:MAG TPA: helix-turn-helix transcriptional regulator [Roseiflexaceae bacterium]|nr:helix-turn-helix transcriptional regulator [Roseiflexaceae bacterium]